VHGEEPSASWHVLAEARHQLQCAVGPSGRLYQLTVSDGREDPGLHRGHDGRVVGVGVMRPQLGVHPVQQLARLVPRQLHQCGHPQRLAHVVHVHDENGDAGQGEHERHDDRDAGHLTRLARVTRLDLADREESVHERRDEQADGELARTVAEQPLHDAR